MNDRRREPDPRNTEAPATIDALIQQTVEVERRWEAAGIERAHERLFAIRELLYDLKRLSEALIETLQAEPGPDAERGLARIAEMVLYEIVPHVEGHMRDLERELGEDG